MVNQVLGFLIDNGQYVCGFVDIFVNVLVDGEWQSMKFESIYDIFGWILIVNIECIELVCEVVVGVDMCGQMWVVNVVLCEEQFSCFMIVFVGGIYWVGSGCLILIVFVLIIWECGDMRIILVGGFEINVVFLLCDEWLFDVVGNLLESCDE